MSGAPGKMPTASGAPDAALRNVRLKDPDAALGVAVRLFLRHENFARLPFGHWSETLLGQIDREHYSFVLRGDKVVGFVGWCFASEENAERWLAGGPLPFQQSKTGDCIIYNAWLAEADDVHKYIFGRMREISRGCKFGYAKRFYKDGRVRALRVRIEPWVSKKLEARAAS